MKRNIGLLIFVLLLVGVMTGCASQDSELYYKGDEYGTVDTDPESPAPVIEDTVIEGGEVLHSAVIPALENRKIIFTAALSMTSENPEDVYNNVVDGLDTYSAYIESVQITSIRYVVKIRVLSENFTDFIEEIKTTGDVVSFNTTSEDVTNSYSTFEARKLALETQHARILELIEQAVDLEDILTLEDARFEIETELNQIGASLANFDSLVDFSTINLVVNKATTKEVILPATSKPSVHVLEITKNTIALEVYNSSSEPVIIYVDVLQNGEFIQQYEKDAYGESNVQFEINGLKSFKEYKFKVTTIAADHRESSIASREAVTDKTFFNRITNVFVISFNSLVLIFQFLGLAVVAVLPYILVGVILFFPTKYLYRLFRSKYPKMDKFVMNKKVVEPQKKEKKAKEDSKHL